MHRLAIFASGSGSNAERIIRYFQGHPDIHIPLIVSNHAEAYVLQRADNLKVPYVVFGREAFADPGSLLRVLQEHGITWIVLAGFLWKVPDELVKIYDRRMINIHPALLPSYGGKGMYGERVHRAVLAAGEKESGITIHYVNERYDEGECIFQARCPVLPEDTPESLADRIHALEHKHFPVVIEGLLLGEWSEG